MSAHPAQAPQGRSISVMRWLAPLVLALAFAGYVGAWVDHKAVGLVITGLDLGEYVKFLTPVRRGEVTLWREGFYLPLIAVSLGASSIAFRARLRYPWLVRALLLMLAIVAALNLLPPAWTPARMATDEFRQQALALLLCLSAVAFSPLLAWLPRQAVAAMLVVLGGGAVIVPVRQFFAILPAVETLYHQPPALGWGLYLCVASLLALATGAAWFGWRRDEALRLD